MKNMFRPQRGFVGVMLLVWAAFVIGWILNIYQVFKTMPATFADMAPFYVAKVVCIFIAPVGSVLGWIGLFQ